MNLIITYTKHAQTRGVVAKREIHCVHYIQNFHSKILFYLLSFYFADINECKQSPSVCRSLAKCSNIEGSFSCQCKIGYTGNGIVNCTGKELPLLMIESKLCAIITKDCKRYLFSIVRLSRIT